MDCEPRPRGRHRLSLAHERPYLSEGLYNAVEPQPLDKPYGEASSLIDAVTRVLLAAALVEPAPPSHPAVPLCAELVWHMYFGHTPPDVEEVALGALLTADASPTGNYGNPWHSLLDASDFFSAKPWERSAALHYAAEFLSERMEAFICRPETLSDVRLAAMVGAGALSLVHPGTHTESALLSAAAVVPFDEPSERAHAFLAGVEADDYHDDWPRAREHIRGVFASIQRLWGERRDREDAVEPADPTRSPNDRAAEGRVGRPLRVLSQTAVVRLVLEAEQGGNLYLHEIAERTSSHLSKPLSSTQVSKALGRIPDAERGDDEDGRWARLTAGIAD